MHRARYASAPRISQKEDEKGSVAAHIPCRELKGKSDETSLTGRHVSAGAVLVTASVVTAACTSTPVTTTNPVAAKPLASGSWPYSNGDLAATRDAAGSTITSDVSGLKQAWTFHIPGPAAGVGPDGALSANPIVVNSVVYIQDLDANVYALTLAKGRLKSEYELNTPMKT
jgi:glucose dehydrogenase